MDATQLAAGTLALRLTEAEIAAWCAMRRAQDLPTTLAGAWGALCVYEPSGAMRVLVMMPDNPNPNPEIEVGSEREIEIRMLGIAALEIAGEQCGTAGRA